jgi:hypothetical protein
MACSGMSAVWAVVLAGIDYAAYSQVLRRSRQAPHNLHGDCPVL